MADKKISQLTERITAVLGTDLLPIVGNVAATPTNLKVQVKNFLSNLAVDLPQTSVSTFKLTANVTANAVAAVLAAGEFVLQANSSAGYTVQDRVGLIIRNEIQNGNSNVTGRMWGLHVKLDTGNSNCVSSNTFGLVIEHTLDANVAAARLVSPRAFIAIKENAGAAGNTTLYLMSIGAQGANVSWDTANVNSSVIFSKANVVTITNKLKVHINGADWWIPVTAAV
jgi:hypothetical protein